MPTNTTITLSLVEITEHYPATSTLRSLTAAVKDGVVLHAYATPTGPAAEDLTPIEAATIAAEDPGLVYGVTDPLVEEMGAAADSAHPSTESSERR